MKEFYADLSSKIIGKKEYLNARDDLFKAYILKSIDERYQLDNNIVKKLCTSLQYFYKSGNESYLNEGAQLVSMLLYVCGDKCDEIVAIADSVFTNSGDFPNINLLNRKFNHVHFVPSIFDVVERNLRKDLNTIEAIALPLTDYQRRLWEDLILDKDILTSAPTSTGKTYIILQYLIQKFLENQEAFAAIVVPTRALIAEVSAKLYEIIKEKGQENHINICTISREDKFKSKTFFVMTQERLFELLQRGDIYFNYLFIDEAHNISDKSRGVLLHLTIQKLLEDSTPQIIISMPSSRYQNAFDSIFNGINLEKKSTIHSPVAKIIIPVTLRKKLICISNLDGGNEIHVEKKFKGDKLANIVYRLGKNENNLIYQSRTDYCENVADDIAALISDNKQSISLEEAANYVENFLHLDFSLANCLRKGVAFHYGPLPGAIRTMIESLAKEGEIQYVVCTSTLAEGVNLPAKNLFLKNPVQPQKMQASEKLEDVTIDNITGRAGRMLEHFGGNVFLVEYDKWKFDYEFKDRKNSSEILSTYFKLLNEEFEKILSALRGEYDHTKQDQYTYYTIANKLIKEYSSENLDNTLQARELLLSKREIKALEKEVAKAYQDLKVDRFTLEANPTIGFIQQNTLFKLIDRQKDLTEWALPHPRSYKLYPTLVKICEALRDAGIFLPQEDISIPFACQIAKKWMIGEPLKEIIFDQITYDKKSGKAYNCNRSVRDVIKVINNDIRFRMSSALRCYHSILSSAIMIHKKSLQNVKLYSFIEAGCCEERAINLVNIGLSRESSIEIDTKLNKDIKITSAIDLRSLYINNELANIHAVTKKEINMLLSRPIK